MSLCVMFWPLFIFFELLITYKLKFNNNNHYFSFLDLKIQSFLINNLYCDIQFYFNLLTIKYLTFFYKVLNFSILKHFWLIINLNLSKNYLNFFFFKNNFFLYNNIVLVGNIVFFSYFFYFIIVFKLVLIFFILFFLFTINFIYNYIKQLNISNYFLKFFILHESEKEIGPIDDIFMFVIIFIVSIVSFILASFSIFFFINNLFFIPFIAVAVVSLLVLSIPLNLFLDFGSSFSSYIKGTGTSSVLIKEVFFDIISTFIVFIRFLIQNIRFLFIFLAIFELLEWVFSNNNNFFSLYFLDKDNINNLLDFQNLNSFTILTLALNFIVFIILYFYYFLHLLFLLLVQISIYIGILLWLFFFLYSTKFLIKYEKFFKKN